MKTVNRIFIFFAALAVSNAYPISHQQNEHANPQNNDNGNAKQVEQNNIALSINSLNLDNQNVIKIKVPGGATTIINHPVIF
ncbi:hypothetical protein AX774_g363 [Zancudomyces culisetae]|uniref:Uncharacterized protein n=1 Tax=Zancudomyces culisetae TaxID=1213189 RepID=A0A1R1PYQ3_ZANCU|nr:hypothetical protein AX774_g363 [Zancudomyces culisetae]|eukprot:OMH86085.1 hypothetical protein AX774_g363 [Zancudomyces culisetae]